MYIGRNASVILVLASGLIVAGCEKDISDKPTISPSAATGQSTAAAPPAAAAPAPALAKSLPAPDWVGGLAPASGVQCYADKVNDQGGAAEGEHRTFKVGEPFTLLGWSVDTSLPANSTQPDVMVVLKGADVRYAFNATRHDRPDVSNAAEFASKAPQNVGVMLNGSLADVRAGSYELQYVLGEGSAAKLCELGSPWNLVVID